jgi:murein DD-endopeptidase MepM/ murein hydrolase activator NlpD
MMDVLKMAMRKFEYRIVANAQPRFLKDTATKKRSTAAERDRALADLDDKVRRKFNVGIDRKKEANDYGKLGVWKSTQTRADGSEDIRISRFQDKNVTGVDGEFKYSWQILGFNKDTADGVIEDIADVNFVTLEDDARNNPARMNQEESDQFKLIGRLSQGEGNELSAQVNEERLVAARAFLIAIRDELKRIDDTSEKKRKSSIQLSNDRFSKNELGQFMLLPKTDFAAVPACNVFFPNQQLNYSMQRDYLSEPTRLMMSVPDLPAGMARIFMAPEGIKDAVVPSEPIDLASYDTTFQSGGYALPLYPISLPTNPNKNFGPRMHPIAGQKKNHQGMDFSVPEGRPVYAFNSGTIAFVRTSPEISKKTGNEVGAGKNISIRHPDGLYSRYFHLSAVNVKKGDSVSAGQIIGLTGNTGGSTGPHLHFELRKGRIQGPAIDPRTYLEDMVAAMEAAGSAANPAARYAGGSETGDGNSLEKSIGNGEQSANKINDYKFLTPEEQVTGIIPSFGSHMSRAQAIFQHGNASDKSSPRDDYLARIVHTQFLEAKYDQRRLGSIPMPFNPSPVAGLPVLVVDKVRSIIAKAVSITHTVRVGGGSGNADTTVTVERPRYWDEGDPYYWVGGEGGKFEDRDLDEGRSVKLPIATQSSFPANSNVKFIDTNSRQGGDVKFGGDKWGKREVDDLYQALLGVNAIPYSQKTRTSLTVGTTAVYNGEIDEIDDKGQRNKDTLVGYYYNLARAGEEIADGWTQDFTRRLGISEKELFVDFLGARKGRWDSQGNIVAAGGIYSGPAFRSGLNEEPPYQEIVIRLVRLMEENDTFRG